MISALKHDMAAFDAVRLECTVHNEGVVVTRMQAEKLHEHGVAHPGEDRWTLADGKTWLDVEAVLAGPPRSCVEF